MLGVVDRESVTAEERAVDDTVFTWPHLLVRHVVFALGVAATVLALGVAFAAPLRDLANPNLTPEPAKAPWYFAGLQELLSHFDPLVAGILVPIGAILTLVLLPYIDRNPSTVARRRKVAIVIFSGLLAIAVVLTVIGTFFRGPGLAVHRAVDALVRGALGGSSWPRLDATSSSRDGSSAAPSSPRRRAGRCTSRCGRSPVPPAARRSTSATRAGTRPRARPTSPRGGCSSPTPAP